MNNFYISFVTSMNIKMTHDKGTIVRLEMFYEYLIFVRQYLFHVSKSCNNHSIGHRISSAVKAQC